MSDLRKDKWLLFGLFLLGLLFFMQNLSVHGLEYRDDEIFYFKSTQEMLQEENYLSPTYFGENRFQKPILFYWFVLFSYQIFGVNWFAARLVAVIFASLTVCLTWLIGRELFNKRIAWLSTVILMTIPLFFRHAKNVVPDMALNFFVVLAVYFAIRFIRDSSYKKYGIFFFVACSLGFMVKGYTAVVIPVATLVFYSLLANKKNVLKEINFPVGLLIFLAIVLPWFLFMIKVHGAEYLKYMLVDETQNRVFSPNQEFVLWKIGRTFFKNILFYLEVLFAYFAPWTPFLVCAVPLAIRETRKRGPESEPLLMMLVWFFSVFIFFSFIDFSINHYFLVLSTPFVILVSYFLLYALSAQSILEKIVAGLRKYYLLFMFSITIMSYGVFRVYFIGSNFVWLLVCLMVLAAVLLKMRKEKSLLLLPAALGVLIVFVYAQSALLAQAGLTPHSTLQRFAETINKDPQKDFIIVVGSHDIHEKEFQVYFDKSIIKAANDSEVASKIWLTEVLDTPQKAYCLIIDKDLERFRQGYEGGELLVVKEDYIPRKRMSFDKDFFLSLLRLDRDNVHHYFMEKIVLIRKEESV